MIIKFLTTEVMEIQKKRKQILIGKLWHSKNAYNLQVGRVGIKKRDGDWDFSEVSLHPGDRVFIKINRFKTNLRDPEYLLYVENAPNASRLAS